VPIGHQGHVSGRRGNIVQLDEGFLVVLPEYCSYLPRAFMGHAKHYIILQAKRLFS